MSETERLMAVAASWRNQWKEKSFTLSDRN